MFKSFAMVYQPKVVAASVAGTSCMTLFSYIYSAVKDDYLKEPKLLDKMIYRVVPSMSKKGSAVSAWALHYAVGLLFAEIYAQTWDMAGLIPGLKHGLAFGAVSGVAAVGIWWLTLKTHPIPPSVTFSKHAVNLLIAHLIFGAVTAVCYKNRP